MATERVDVVVAGGGVVGVAAALALARRGAAVVLLEARPGLALQATGTNSGVLHTGFDSKPGELETELILRAAAIRDPVLETLGVPVLRCGAVIEPATADERAVVDDLERGARANGVDVVRGPDGRLVIPGESVTDPVALTLALAGAAIAAGADVRVDAPVTGLRADGGSLVVEAGGGDLSCDRRRQRRRPARRRGRSPGRRRDVRDLPAQGRVPRLRPAGRARSTTSTSPSPRRRPRACSSSRRSTAAWRSARPRTTRTTRTTGACGPRARRRCARSSRSGCRSWTAPSPSPGTRGCGRPAAGATT